MESLNAQSKAAPEGITLLDAVEKQDLDDQQILTDFSSIETQDVIGSSVKKAKTVDEIPLAPISISEWEKVKKAFYIESPEIAAMTDAQVGEYRKEMDGIKVRGVDCPKPIKKWEQLGLSLKSLQIIRGCGYERPTPIQTQAIPAVMLGRDFIGIAKTGSGKTLAFVLPLLRHVLDQRSVGFNEGPVALILTPTRELALQIFYEVKKFSAGTKLRTVACYGGPPIKDQISDLKRGAEIVVSTPGRMIDLLCANSGKVTNLRRATYYVLDEADRMFDSGFEPQIMKIFECSRPDRQTVMFSATFPKSMEALARRILTRPVEVVVGGRSIVCQDVEQIVEVLEEEDKFCRLLQILGRATFLNGETRILVFVERQEAADHLLRDLLRKGYPSLSLHGGKDQADRDCTILDFKNGIIPILIATSVASRGLDVKELSLVINYDCPNHMEDYVHRVGRTGRAGNKGTAYTFVTPDQTKYAVDIVKALKASKAAVPDRLQKLADDYMEKIKNSKNDSYFLSAASGGGGFGGKGLSKMDLEREMIKNAQKMAFKEDHINKDGFPDDKALPLQTKDSNSVVSNVSAEGSQASAGLLPFRMRDSFASPYAKSLAAVAEKIHAKLANLGIQIEDVDPVKEINEKLGFSSTCGTGDIVPIPEGSAAAVSPSGQRMSYCCEIEINDFPQQTRWKVTNRDNLNSVTYATTTAVTVRGTYIQPGKSADGERKLFLYIEGETESNVAAAREEIRRLLSESMAQSGDSAANTFGRSSASGVDGGSNFSSYGRYKVV